MDNVTLAGKLRLEKGWGLDVCPQSMHLKAEYWGVNADNFDPARFVGTNLSSSPAFAAFSLGPRMCIGKQVALLEIAVSLAMLVTHFKIAPVKPLEECLRWKSRLTREFENPVPYELIPLE